MKYVLTIIISILVGTLTVNAGYNALKYFVDPPVWQYSPDNQNLSTHFNSNQDIKVYKIVDGATNCYISVSQVESPGTYTDRGYSPGIKNMSHSLSCVK